MTRNPITLSQELFSSHDGHSQLVGQNGKPSLDELLLSTQPHGATTINPPSPSPALSPVPEEDDVLSLDAAETTLARETSPDVTQHPAEVLCSDLQCPSAGVSRTWAVSQQPLTPALALYCQLTILLTSTSTMLSICKRPLMQIAMSLKAGFSLRPTPALLNTIVWLLTKPSSSRAPPNSTLTSSSTTKRRSRPAANPSSTTSSRPGRPSTILRLKLLRKILTCSPMLARPLTDATMAALRLVRSEEVLDVSRVNGVDVSPATPRSTAGETLDGGWPYGTPLPSAHVLITLLWAIKVEERRILSKRKARGRSIASRPER